MVYITKILKINEKEVVQICFQKDTPYYILNMYRCALMSYVPTFALTKSIISTNTTLYSDEIILQRISFIPVHIPDKYKGLEDKLSFKIDKTNEENKNIDITTNNFIITFNNNDNISLVDSNKFFDKKSYEDYIPIVSLYNSQRDTHKPCLQLELSLEKKIGYDNVCYSPVSVVSIDDDILNVEFTHTNNADISIYNAREFIKNQITTLINDIFNIDSDDLNLKDGNKFSVNININKFPMIHTMSIYIQQTVKPNKFTFVSFEKNHPLKSNTRMRFCHKYKSNSEALKELQNILKKFEKKI